MLIPQFTLRSMLKSVAVAAVVSLALSFAVRGYQWAIAASLAVAALALTMALQALVFWLVWLFATYVEPRLRARIERRKRVKAEAAAQAPQSVTPA